ncbi:MAG: AGE family epimerase/isomerase, partial [Bifidobacteriaceae bacterium]|nr:AGE family epimerase/isomerase [Bifidobacteriaceae bacterium]
MSYLSPEDAAWLADQTEQLLAFGQAAAQPEGGFGWLDQTGQPDPSHHRQLWVNCRMVHVYAIGALLGHPGSAELVTHGL